MKQWKRLAALSSAIVMAAATLTYFPSDTLQNIRLEISASAETTTEPQVWIEDNLTWTLTANGTLTISGAGAMKDYDYDSNPSPVYHNSKVKKIVIENGVTSIGESAFYGCSSLTSITIPDSVISIGEWAFYDCSSLTSITIPKSVTSIGSGVFDGCSSLISITIPDSVISIGYSAFYNCSSLTSITIPDSVTSIGTAAFQNCSSLISITIPDSVTSIGTAAFSDCGLISITIPNGVTSIGDGAFYGCSSLTSITIPKSVTSIGNDAFYGCNNLTVYLENGSTLTSNDLGVDESKIAFYYQWNEDNLTWTLDADGTLTISGTGAMKNYNSSDNRSPAYNNSNVKKVVIEDGVTSIGNSAFDSCSNLTSITIPNSVTSIGAVAFYGCSSLTSITIPDGVTSIGNWAFDSCSNLKTISLSCKSTLKKSNFSNQANLVSASHTLKKTAAKAATCAEDGNIEYWTCEHCGKYFLSDDINPETAKAVELSETVISASHKLTKVEAKAVTCAEDGNIEYWTCEHCGKYFLSDDTNPETAKAVELSETVIPALNHKNAIIQNASEPTETDPGYSGDRYCPDCDKVLEEGYTYWIEDNLTWKLYEDGTLTISGTGAMKNYNSDDNPSPAYWNTIVRKIVIEDGVTSIGKSAFSDCSNLTSITIPDSVTSIGNDAFYNCTSLTSITIPDSVTIIGDSAFFYCISLTNITLSNNITNIGNDAFYSCRSLTSITIPSSVTSIGNLAFYGCSSLTSITIPDSVTSIGDSAIRNCSSLTSITIPDSVTSIGYAAFYDCKNLKTISLSCKSTLKKSDFGGQADLVSYTPHTLTKTEAKAATCTKDGNKEYWICEHCKKYFLSDDTNPATATAVEQSECMIPAIQHKNAITRGAVEPTETDPGYSGDRYCPDCDTVLEKGYTYWNEGNLTWKLYEDGKLTISGKGTMKDYNSDDNPSPASQKKDSVKKVVIEDGVTSIGTAAFSGCGLISITIPNSVTSIENTAFSGCSSLTSITIPDSVTSIGTGAFSYCKSLTSITIPDSVTSIGTAAFSGCGLISITIPNSVTSIETGAFYNCSSLTSITIPDSVTSIGDSAFESCSSLTNITIPDSVTSIEDSAFESCSNLTSITIPDSVTSIGDSAFESCSSLTNITIPDSVTSIGAGAFYNCSSLTSITIPDSVTSIGVGAFYNCSSLTSITIPGGVTSIGMYAFYNCSSLTSITIPDSVTSIGMYAFSDCSSLTSITIPDSVTSIEESAFESCSSLTSITIPKSVTSIESGVFNNCNNLTVYLESGSTLTSNDLGVDESKIVSYHRWNEDNLTWKLYADGTLNISGTGAMKDYDYSDNRSPVYMNSSVKKIVIEDGVTSIGNWAFSDCSGLISITIPNSVASIGDWAFYYCTSLTTITIPDSVTSIGEAAFRFCSSLTSITIPDGVTSIGSSAFRGCTSLTSITIPDSVTSIGDAAFYYCTSLTSITIPDSVTSIGNKAFSDCTNLKTISLSCKSSLKRSNFGNQADLVSYTSHTLKKTEAKAVTCSEDGNKEYWTCEHCKKYFLSDDTNPETATAVELSETVIPASHKLTKVDAKAATCTEDGNIEYWQCDVCKKTFTDEAGKNAVDNVIIPALKHSYNENGFCENDDTHYQPANYNEEIEKYEISNAGQLYWFAEQVNSGNASVNAVLTTDIVVNEGNLATYDGTSPNTWMTWIPIGNARVYSGTFDGQGHTISGLYVNSNDNYIGLFGVVMSGSNIKNIGVINSYFKGNDFVGGIAGAVNESSFVQNCYSINTISGNDYIGGICGMFGSNNTNIKKCYAVCNIHPSENATHVGGVIGSGEYVNISDCYYDSDIFSGKAYTDVLSSANAKNVEGKTTAQFASGEVTYLLNDDQSNIIFYQDLATEKYPTLNQKSKVVMQLEMIYDESFGEDATTNKTYHNAGDTIALETSPDKAYTYQYFVDGKQIEEPTYTLTGNTKMTVKSVPVEIKLSEIDTIQLTYQKKTTLNLTEYLKNFADLKPMQFQLDADSKLPEGLTLAENGILSGIPEKAAENVKTTLILTAKNGTTKNMELTFHIAKADPTVEVAVSGDSHTEGDLVSELKLILSENSTKGVVEIVSEIKALVAGKNTFTWKFTPEDENNYHTVTGTVVVNAQTTTTTTTTTKATTTTTKATTTNKPSKTTTTKATTTTKPSKTTTTKVTTTTKPSKTTTTNVTTTTKPSKTTTTKVTTTTKPSKTTTTKVTTTTKPSKTTTTNVTTTTKPSKTTTTKVTTTTKPSKTTTTKVTTTTKPSKTTTTNATTTNKPSKTTTTNATTTNTAIPFYGDVNLDGKVDILDAVYLNRYLATLIQFSDAQVANADCYQDGVLNDQDTTALMQFIILLIDDLPVQPTEK